MQPDRQKGRKSSSAASSEPTPPLPATSEARPPSEPRTPVRRASRAELDAVAELHAEEIDEGFLSTLGLPFLRRLYHRIDRAPGSFVLVGGNRGGLDGFVAGSVDVAALYRSFLWRDGPGAAVVSAPRLARSWRRVVETLRRQDGGGAPPGSGELLSIAVAPRSQGRGVGVALVEAFLEELARREVHCAHVVVAASNRRAVGLYRRCGFAPARSFELHAGTTSLLMERRGGKGSGRPLRGDREAPS